MTNLELVNHDKYYHIFIENHLNIYPKERIETLGICEPIDPLSGIKLYNFSESLKKSVINNNLQPNHIKILKDLHMTADRLNINQ